MSPFVSPFLLGGVGVFDGYKKVVLCECEAMTATSFALPDAKCALMKTRMLASAAERDSVDPRYAQACGFVSSTIVSSDGGGAVYSQRYEHGEVVPGVLTIFGLQVTI